MPESERYSLNLYQSYVYVAALLGMIFSLTLVFYKFQVAWEIPDWIQYLVLVVIIVISFFSAPYLATKPASFEVTDHVVSDLLGIS